MIRTVFLLSFMLLSMFFLNAKALAFVQDQELMLRMNCGGDEVTINEKDFLKDQFDLGGGRYSNNAIANIQNTIDDEVYKTERNGSNGFSYEIPITNGTFTIKLHFAEIYFGATGGISGGANRRVFDVKAEGGLILDNLDIYQEVGAEYAVVKEFLVTVADGKLNLDFDPSIDGAKLSALEIFGNGTVLFPPNLECDWTTLTSSSEEKLEAPSAKVNGKIYVISGFKAGLIIVDTLGIYDPVTDTWTTGAPIPVAVTHMGVVVHDSEIWILGGFVGDHPGTATNLVQVYNTMTDTWRTETSLPNKRGSLAAAIVGDKIHVFGGLKEDRMTDVGEHYVLDLNNQADGWIAKKELLHPRNHLSGAAVNGKVYAIGGQFGHDGGADDQNFLEEYDPNTDIWTRKANLLSDRSHFEPGTLVYGNKIIIVGGRNQNQFFDTISAYDTLNDIWEELCRLPNRLLAPVAQEIDDKLYIANGGIDGIGSPINTVRSMTLEIRTLEINSVAIANHFSLLPNPATTAVKIKGNASITSINMYSIAGQLIKTINDFDTSETLDISEVPTGIYLLSLRDSRGNGLATKKLIVE